MVSSTMPELVELAQQLADEIIVIDHRVVVVGLPTARTAFARRLDVGPKVHVRGVEPHEERLVGATLSRMKSKAASRNSSSTVSIRFLVSGPVSSIRWEPSAWPTSG